MRLLITLSYFLIVYTAHSQNDSAVRYITDSGYFSSFDKTRIFYTVRGKGYPVFLIHGFIVNSSTWEKAPVLQDLLNNGFKVITMDLRGNGRSDKPKDEARYANDAEARDIIALADQLRFNAFDVVGYSRGSIIAARMLVLDKRVHKAVLGGMGTGFTDSLWPRRIMFYEAFMGKPVKELEGVVSYVKQQGLDTLVLAYLQKYQPSTSPEALGAVSQNVLVISGKDDADNGSAADLAKMFHHATLATVPGDHNHAAGTREFGTTVTNFLKDGR